MANLKEIKSRIVSIGSTMQITSAMKMVSAAKLKRAQNAITQMRPYANKLTELLANLSSSLESSEQGGFSIKRKLKKVLIIPITSNRGLCGGFNSNIIEGQSYIDYLTNNGDSDISNDIISGLDLAKDKISNLDNNFRLQLLNDNSSMLEAYDALQQVVVDLKTDMLISLQITVDYVDADGD